MVKAANPAPADAAEVTSASIETQCLKLVGLCRALSRLFFIAALCFTGLLMAILMLTLLSAVTPAVIVTMSGDAKALLPMALGICSLVTLAWTLWAMTRTMVKNESPFNAVTRRGMAILSLMYCLVAVVQLIPCGKASIVIEFAGITTGLISGASGGTISVTTVGAAVLFAVLALVFKYGSLLQRVSDDTV